MIYHHQYSNKEVSAVPTTFTSNTSISGYVCSASNTNSSNYPWKIWKQDYTTSEWAWWPGNVSLPQWVQIEVPEAFVPTSFMVMNEIATPASMKAGIFQGSNNGSNWTDLYTISDWPADAGYRNTMELSTNNAYKYYRLYVTDGWVSGDAVSIQAMKIFKRDMHPSSGFNNWGKPVKYRSAKLAKCNWNPIPQEGLVFYASLAEDSATAETGQTFTKNSKGNGISFQTYKNVPCVRLQDGSNMKVTAMTDIPTGNNPFTISAWHNLLIRPDDDYGVAGFGYGTDGERSLVITWFSAAYEGPENNIAINIRVSSGLGTGAKYVLGNWYHVACTFDGTTFKTYANGVFGDSGTRTLSMGNTAIYIGALNNNQTNPWRGYLAGCRIYNRALDESEIAKLANEFHPTND